MFKLKVWLVLTFGNLGNFRVRIYHHKNAIDTISPVLMSGINFFFHFIAIIQGLCEVVISDTI
jgi:hypothetical protein